MTLSEAKKKADEIISALFPYCKRVEIAGSIRREKPEVGDIEIVLIPDTSKPYQYREAINKYSKIKGDPLGKYTQRWHPSGVKIDFFICIPETWACNFFIRTGSAEFVHNIMKSCRNKKIQFIDARLFYSDTLTLVHNINEEIDVFKALGMEWVEPRERS